MDRGMYVRNVGLALCTWNCTFYQVSLVSFGCGRGAVRPPGVWDTVAGSCGGHGSLRVHMTLQASWHVAARAAQGRSVCGSV